MAFRNNGTLVQTANKIDVTANGNSDVYSGADQNDGKGGAYAFIIADGAVGDDTFVSFGGDDTIITGKKIFDGNGDGYIAFGDNAILDVDRTSSKNAGEDQISVLGNGGDRVTVIRYLGTKDGGFAYADAGTRDALLGHFASGFESSTAVGDSSVAGQIRHIDNDVGNNSYDFSGTSVALLTDNALGLNFGGDTIDGFGTDDLLIFTSKLYDSDNDNIVTFGGNKILDLSGAGGPLSSDPSQGPGGQFDVNNPNKTQVYYLGEKNIDGTNYYYYGAAANISLDGVQIAL